MNDKTNIKKQLSCLNEMSKKSVAVYHRFALSIGVSDSTFGLLYALSETEKPCSQHDLCGRWSVPKQTVNTAAAVLQRRGLISSAPISGTRNKKNILLTEAGRDFADKTVVILREAELAALGELTSEEREIYVRLNEKYNRSLTEKIDKILEKKAYESAERK